MRGLLVAVSLLVSVVAQARGEVDCKDLPEEFSPYKVLRCCDVAASNRTKTKAELDLMEGAYLISQQCQKFEGFKCFYECMLVKLGLISEDGTKLNREKITDFIKVGATVLQEKDVADVGVSAAEKCVSAFESSYSANFKEAVCQTEILEKVSLCAQVGLVVNCPASKFSKDPSCSAAKDVLQKCSAEITKLM